MYLRSTKEQHIHKNTHILQRETKTKRKIKRFYKHNNGQRRDKTAQQKAENLYKPFQQ